MDNETNPAEEWKQLTFGWPAHAGIDLAYGKDVSVIQEFERVPTGELKLIKTEVFEGGIPRQDL